MYEDYFLESDYEDKYTIHGDWDEEDKDLETDNEDDYDNEEEEDISVRSHNYDEMRYPEWTEQSYAS